MLLPLVSNLLNRKGKGVAPRFLRNECIDLCWRMEATNFVVQIELFGVQQHVVQFIHGDLSRIH